ncbi:MAG: ion transporter [SAR116 cluster bacterium]|jgi:voltage-gated sodium channel|nr:MAG: ion transporter [SAR116 cluster bacterium]
MHEANPNQITQKLLNLIESNLFTFGITALILVNAITLGLETDQSITARYGGLLHWIDRIILVLFSIELLLKFYVYRFRFFRSGWNLFDLAIVAIAWAPTSGALTVLRALRILRVLRLISVVPQLRRVVSAIGHSIPGMVSVVGVLGLIFYVASVLATKLFGTYPDPNMQEWFGSIGASAYTLFQIMTLESWSMGVVRPTMELFPWAWSFFIPFIIITSFAVLNFFIGIIVDSMQIVQKQEETISDEENKHITMREYKLLKEQLDLLTTKLGELQNQRENN